MPLAYIHFEPCPICSETNTPQLNIAKKVQGGYKYRAVCRTCRYEQSDAYDSIKECAKAWNEESCKAWSYMFQLKCERRIQQLNDLK